MNLPEFLLVPIQESDHKALEDLAKDMDLSEDKVLIQGLRLLQLCRVRGYDKVIEKLELQKNRRGGTTLDPCWHEGIRYIAICDDCGYEEDQ